MTAPALRRGARATAATRPAPTAQVRAARDGVTITLPVKTVSEPNARDGWAPKHRRSSGQRGIVALMLRPQVGRLGLPVRVRLVRLSAGELDDDNLRGALKAVRDGVADALGLRDDRDPRVTAWDYDQERVPRGAFGIEVTVTRAPQT